MFLTDPSPAMVAQANAKLVSLGGRAEVAAGEDMEDFAARYLAAGGARFDGAFSNFAPLNCVEDLGPVARGLATFAEARRSSVTGYLRHLLPRRDRSGNSARSTASGAATLQTRFGSSETREARLPCRLPPTCRDGARLRSVVFPGEAARHWCGRAAKRCRALDFSAASFACGHGGGRPCPRTSSGDVWRSRALSISKNLRFLTSAPTTDFDKVMTTS